MTIFRTRRRAVIVGVVAATVALAAGASIAVAGAATTNGDAKAATAQATATHDSPDGATFKLLGTAARLMSDQQFRADVTKLGMSMRPDLMQWHEKYGQDATSAAAIGALKKLGEQWSPAAAKLLGDYGIDLDAIRAAAHKTSAKMLKLMRDDDFRADLWRIRDAREAETDAWWDAYADDPTSDEALSAMAGIEKKYGEQLTKLTEQNGVDMEQCMHDLISGVADAIDTQTP